MNDATASKAAAAGRQVASRVPLIFIRHGETDWNREARLQGQQDIPLNGLGRRQAERNGRALAGVLAAGDWRAIASPLSRAAETMRILLAAAGRPDVGFEIDPILKEISYGDWEGLTLAEVAHRDADGARARERDKWSFVPPAGESYALGAERVGAWLESLDGPSLVVAHGGILRILLHLLAGLPSHDAPYLATPQDRVVLFTRTAVFTI
ncbi:MAG: histidine phosphatase family protein [Rhizobiales bacterium]|nr:histidine phosphatase family protein [Hyphomicrobiales bacterium]